MSGNTKIIAEFELGTYTYMRVPNGISGGVKGPIVYYAVLKNGEPYGFAFDEQAARHMCFALSFSDSTLAGNSAVTGELLSALKSLGPRN